MGTPDLPQLIGERLRAARTIRGWSLGHLAELAGIGKGSLSEIENGTRNPTLSTLYALANSLDRPMSWLLAEQVGARVGGPGIATRLLDVTVLAGVTVEVYAIRLDAGCRHESDPHGPAVVEHLLVVGGQVAAGVVGAEQVLATGMSTKWVSDRRHAYQALGDAPADVVLVIRWGAGPAGPAGPTGSDGGQAVDESPA
jgi:transcriptional regulator with XRE-family HTH domain